MLQLAKNDPAAGTPEEKKPPADSASPISAATLASDAAASDQTATPDMTSAVGTDANKASSLDPNPTGNASDVNPDPFRPFDPRRGSNVVFVLDQSLSMKGEKSTAARRELVKTLQDLGTNQSFYILFFHSSGYDAMPATGMLRATPQNIRSVTNWIHSAGHHWGSDPTKAMLRALELEPDTIWLLSDGAFPAATREMIHLANDGIHAHIYTVGFFSHSGEEVLRQIAQENGGSYHFVPSPKEKQALERALSPSPHTFDNSGPASP